MLNLRRKRKRSKKYNIVDCSKPFSIEKTKIISMKDSELTMEKNSSYHKKIVLLFLGGLFLSVMLTFIMSYISQLAGQSNLISIDDTEEDVPVLKRCDKRITISNSSLSKLPDSILTSIKSPTLYKSKN